MNLNVKREGDILTVIGHKIKCIVKHGRVKGKGSRMHHKEIREAIEKFIKNEEVENTMSEQAATIASEELRINLTHQQQEWIHNRLSQAHIIPLLLTKDQQDSIFFTCMNSRTNNPFPFTFLVKDNGEQIGKGNDYPMHEHDVLIDFTHNMIKEKSLKVLEAVERFRLRQEEMERQKQLQHFDNEIVSNMTSEERNRMVEVMNDQNEFNDFMTIMLNKHKVMNK